MTSVNPHPTPITLVTALWGYKSHTTGPASVTYAALIKYGLMTDEGNGDARVATLTDLAVTILMSPDKDERESAIRTAALKPPIYADMWAKHGADLPDEKLLHYQMVTKGPFTENGFEEFIRVYRAVIAFAKLGSADKATRLNDDPAEDGGSDDEATDDGAASHGEQHETHGALPPRGPRRTGSGSGSVTTQAQTQTQTIAVPMIGAPAVMVEGSFPLTEQEWQYFISVLTAMKPGLVAGDVDDKDEQPEELGHRSVATTQVYAAPAPGAAARAVEAASVLALGEAS